MLDTQTKRKIDKARNILVGIVPDPKSQVDQITTALMYKFMDDMDKEAQELGGKPKYFTDEYSSYSWTKLMDKKLSGQERLNLYLDALANMPKNPNIPQLFRDIFNGSFLPHRNERTLNLFLKEIDGFNYDNSENLGNAFEYLLSILGSQGDAGQFRTPRHIIDFVTEIVDPKKTDTILDPACGTAGFLISAYKHIVKNNSSIFKQEQDSLVHKENLDNKKYSGDLLSPEDKNKLTQNIKGYDISPEMVKLALVNLYLHGFSDPQIFQYDTLSSDKRWGESFDVILANPPFMTPKGGIIPHNKFSIQANRAEVLFVDYIAEHLSIKGRAGIIVPEGIIFQSAKAYKSLRKNLIENWGLYAVVSLPSGVFNPYSGVKTSILLIDRELSKKTNDILFLKVENDGHDLGAQRRKIDKNDLPKCLKVIDKWKKDQTLEEDSKIALTVSKQKIAENGEYNLTGERYSETVDYSNAKWEMVELGEFLEEKTERVKEKDIQVWSVSNTQGFVNTEEYFEKQVASANTSNYKIINPNYFAYNPSRINVGSIAFNESKNIGCVSPMYVIFEIADKKLNSDYLFKILKSKEADKEINLKSQGAVRKQLRYKDLITIKIPLPPLEVQEQIVAEIEGYQKVIDGAKQVVENWKPNFRIDPNWEMVELREVADFKNGLWKGKKEPFQTIKIIRNTNFGKKGELYLSDVAEHPVEIKQLETRKLEKGDIVLENSGGGPTQPVGRVVYFETDDNAIYSWSNFTSRIRVNNKNLNSKYLYFVLDHFYQSGKTENFQKRTSGIRNLDKKLYQQIQIPLPPLEVQEQIVAEIEAEQKVVNANKELIEKMEKKVEARLSEVWGEEI